MAKKKTSVVVAEAASKVGAIVTNAATAATTGVLASEGVKAMSSITDAGAKDETRVQTSDLDVQEENQHIESTSNTAAQAEGESTSTPRGTAGLIIGRGVDGVAVELVVAPLESGNYAATALRPAYPSSTTPHPNYNGSPLLYAENLVIPWRRTGRPTTQAALSPIELVDREIELPTGLTVLMAGPGVGKSKEAYNLAARLSEDRQHLVSLLSIAEPLPLAEFYPSEGYGNADAQDDLLTFFEGDTYTEMFCRVLTHMLGRYHQFLKDDDSLSPNDLGAPILIIDSLRAALYEVQGAAGDKGMIMRFFADLTRFSNLAGRLGVHVIATINPLQEDAQLIDLILSRLHGATQAVVSVTDTTSTVISRLTGRQSVTLPRRTAAGRGELLNQLAPDASMDVEPNRGSPHDWPQSMFPRSS